MTRERCLWEDHPIKKVKSMKVTRDKTKGYNSRICQEIRKEMEMSCEYGIPLKREWDFLKFSYIDGAFEKRETNELFTFSIPERIKTKSNSTMQRKALEGITPSVWIEMKNKQKKLRMVSRARSEKKELYTLEKKLRELLEKNRCPTKGISEKRTDIFMDLFDELIRQVTIDYSPEAGQLLVQIRNHYRETLLLHKLIFENSQSYAYRKQIQIKDEREEELKAEIDRILRREKELVDEMRSVERGIILSQERMFYRMVHKAEHYRQEVNYYTVNIMRAFDLLEACLPPEFKDSINEVRDKEIEKKREELKKDEQRKRLEGEDESEKSVEEEEVEEEEEVKTRGMKALEDLIYRSDEEEVFEESTTEESDDEFSEPQSAPTPIAGLDMTAEKIAFQRLKALDSIKTITLAEMDKGEVLAHKVPAVIIDIPIEIEKKEEVIVKKFEDDDEEPEEETEAYKERARRRKLQSMGLAGFDDEETEIQKQEGKEEEELLEQEEEFKAIAEEEETKSKKEDAVEEEQDVTDYSLAMEEEEEEEEEEEGAGEQVTEMEEWHPRVLGEGLDEEGEGELEQEIEIVSSSSGSVSEEEETRKDQGKKRQKPKSTIIISKDLVDVEMGETDTSDFEEEEEGEGSRAS